MHHLKNKIKIILTAALLSSICLDPNISFGMKRAENKDKINNSGKKKNEDKEPNKPEEEEQRKDIALCYLIKKVENEEELNKILTSTLDSKDVELLTEGFFKCVYEGLNAKNALKPSKDILYRFYLAYSQYLTNIRFRDDDFWSQGGDHEILDKLIKSMNKIQPESYFTLLTQSWYIRKEAYNLYGKTIVKRNDKGRAVVIRYSADPPEVQKALKAVVSLIEKAIKLNPEHPAAYSMMSSVKGGLNDLNSAYYYFEKYMDKLPKNFPNKPLNFGFGYRTFYSDKKTRLMMYNSSKERGEYLLEETSQRKE